MTTKLIQKHLLKGTREFEILEDEVIVRSKSRLKDDTLSVTLAVLNPEPVITKSQLEFVSRVNGEALLSLALSKPNVAEFNDFVNTLKQRAQAEYNTYSGISIANNPSAAVGGLNEEPPEFDELSTEDMIKDKKIDLAGLQEAIEMLETYVNNDEIKPLMSALHELAQSPEDYSKLLEVANLFENLKSSQGAVLSYAPYIGIMLADDPFKY